METKQLKAFQEGEKNCIELNGEPKNAINPYEKYSDCWKMHNRGWNNQLDKLPENLTIQHLDELLAKPAFVREPKELIRVRIYPFDYDGSKSNMTYVTYVSNIKDAENMGWKYEIA